MRVRSIVGSLVLGLFMLASCSGEDSLVKGTSTTGAGAAGGSGGATTTSNTTTQGTPSDDDGDGFTEADGDCNDNNKDVHPDAVEICDDNVDNNCNGATDVAEPDADGDGFGPCQGDCDDTNKDIHPAAAEVPGDNIDNNCDGVTDADLDGDGYAEADGDCDDNDAAVNPGVVENCFDGIDNDCNTFIDDKEPDVDMDGFGPCNGDCAEGDPNIGPNQPEIPNDGIDNNCDNLIDVDIDGDGWTVQNGDCNDNDKAINPAALEICDDKIDNNCDNNIDTDCLSPCELAEVMRSSVGCSFFAVDTNPIHSFVAGDYAIAVSNIDSNAAANVIVEVKSGNNWSTVSGGSFSVGALSLKTLVLPHRYTQGSAIYKGGAYRITSDLPVIAYQFNPLNGASSFLSDASLLLPTSAFDKYYIVPAWPYGPSDGSSNSGHPAHVQVVASKATEVRVVSPITTVAGSGVPSLTPNVQEKFQLAEGDYLQLTVKTFKDSFNGTYIESDEPIAVFTSNDCANVPALGNAACCCEHLEEQVFGLQTWGTSYVGARVPQRKAEGVIWQIMAQSANTTVSFNANAQVTGLPANVTLNAKEMVQYEVGGPGSNPGDFLVTADKPILVTQYMVGTNYAKSNNLGDPSMIQAVPVQQYLKQYVVLVPTTWQNDYFVLIREQGATVSIDNNLVNSGWVQVGNSKYEVARQSVADGVHQLAGSLPFGVIVIGYDSYDSYGYPGGLDQAIINPIK